MENTIEQNKLIAEFEGHKINWGFNKKSVYFINTVIPESDLKYNSSWDWLMPVVEKIESLRFKGKAPWTDIKTFLTLGETYHECNIKIYLGEDAGYLYESESM